MTLKGGVREVLAAEALHPLGVDTSRCLSLVETGEALWRGDEPSPTRSSVMIRLSRSHIRFGTFERLHFLRRSDSIEQLLDHVIDYYYPEVAGSGDRYGEFYAALVERVAKLAAQWMAAGFCHGVLNTDNMSITGESFDYGPYAFMPTYDPGFTAAYFDRGGRYCYGNQPAICRLNLEMLQLPLATVIPWADLEAAIAGFDGHYQANYRQLMLEKLGFEGLSLPEAGDLVEKTLQILQETGLGYHAFFAELAGQFHEGWRESRTAVLESRELPQADWETWRHLYHRLLTQLPLEAMEPIGNRLRSCNPKTALLRPTIESVWEPIAFEDNWQPFQELVRRLQARQ